MRQEKDMQRKDFKIGKKIAKKMLTIYLTVMLALLIVLFSVVIPAFLNVAKQSSNNLIQMIRDQYEATQKQVSAAVYNVIAMKELEGLLEKYASSPGKNTGAEIELYLSEVKSSSNLLFVMVELLPGETFGSIHHRGDQVTEFISENPQYKQLSETKSTYFSPIYTGDEGLYFKGLTETPVPFGYYSAYRNTYGVEYIVTVCYSAYSLLKTTGFAADMDLDAYYAFNKQGECIYATDTERIEEAEQVAAQIATDKILWEDGRYYFGVSIIDNGMKFVGEASWFTLLSALRFLIISVSALFIIPPLLFYLIAVPAQTRYLYPLKLLARNMSDFSIGSQPPSVIQTGDEIQEVSAVFNHMVEKTNEQASALVQGEQEKAVAMYKLLTLQLEPHFVYNTMNIINIMARENRGDDIIAINNALRRILRERLNTGQTIYDTVKKEVDTLKQYMIIMGYRYENKVVMDYDVQEELQEERIIKNILQPLVENAFYHGLTGDDGEIAGSISVLVYQVEDRIELEVSDDGKGFDSDTLAWLQSHEFRLNRPEQKGDIHIGLENIYGRLKHVYGHDFTMDVRSAKGYGSTIILSLPKLTLQKDPDDGI